MPTGSILFRILGPIEVAVDGRTVPVGGAKLRTLLAVLLLAEGQSVTVPQLIVELWGEQPPATARTALQVYLSGLRKFLGDRLLRVGGGYRLEAGDLDVDATLFVRRIAQAKDQLAVRRLGPDPGRAGP